MYFKVILLDEYIFKKCYIFLVNQNFYHHETALFIPNNIFSGSSA